MGADPVHLVRFLPTLSTAILFSVRARDHNPFKNLNEKSQRTRFYENTVLLGRPGHTTANCGCSQIRQMMQTAVSSAQGPNLLDAAKHLRNLMSWLPYTIEVRPRGCTKEKCLPNRE